MCSIAIGQGLENKVFYATSRNEVMCEMDYFVSIIIILGFVLCI